MPLARPSELRGSHCDCFRFHRGSLHPRPRRSTPLDRDRVVHTGPDSRTRRRRVGHECTSRLDRRPRRCATSRFRCVARPVSGRVHVLGSCQRDRRCGRAFSWPPRSFRSDAAGAQSPRRSGRGFDRRSPDPRLSRGYRRHRRHAALEPTPSASGCCAAGRQ